MHIIAIENAFSNGYHELQLRPYPPAALLLPVTKKYGNRREPHACLVWAPEMEQIPALYGTMLQMRNVEKDF